MKNKKKLKGKDLINIGIDHDAAFMCDCPNIWRYSIYAFFDKS